MQKISRIYVGGYGINIAWYDGVVLDLIDPTTNRATSTVLNLENGGGKTTLLSFIFSCFDTPTERFLKHLQNRNHLFNQYFSRNGAPGIVMIEWQMPPRSAGAQPYSLVIGQAVSVKTGSENDEVERVFFSFETGAMRFDSAPVKPLTWAPVTSMKGFLNWLQDGQRQDPGVFYTRVQHDWQRHLRERMIDVDMLKLQVGFSVQEGGIDSGFLTFKSEPEFVRKFLSLTLDDSLVASVRQSVVEICDKLRRKPQLQKCLTELTQLRNALVEFNDKAQLYVSARADQGETLIRGARLILGLEKMVEELDDAAEKSRELYEERSRDAEAHERTSKQRGEDVISLKLLSLTQSDSRAKEALAKEVAQATGAEAELRNLKAAKAQSEIQAAQQVLDDVLASGRAEREALVPWKEKAEELGSKLRHSLEAAKRKADEAVQDSVREVSGIEERQGALRAERKALDSHSRGLDRETTKLHSEEMAYSEALNRIKQDGLIQPDEPTAEAAQRHAQMAESSRAKAMTARASEAEFRKGADTNSRQAQDANREKVGLEHRIAQTEALIKEGEAEHKRLSQMDVLKRVAQADWADLDSPALIPALEQYVRAEQQAALDCGENKIGFLKSLRDTIEKTGFAWNSTDVSEVVRHLREMGIKSAQPYNTYLSRTVEDAAVARELVLSNPGRFLGVAVATSELERARGVLAHNLQLSTPVMVSVTSLTPDVSSEDRFVLPVEDAAFNQDAAQKRLSQIEAEIRSLQQQQQDHLARAREAASASKDLKQYLERHSAEQRNRARAELERLTLELKSTQERATELEAQAVEAQRKAEEARKSISEQERVALDAERASKDLKIFMARHEAGHADRVSRLEELPRLQAEVEEKSALLEAEETALARRKDEAVALQAEMRSRAGALAQEAHSVKFYNLNFPADEQLAQEPMAMGALKRLYDDAVRLYQTESSQRLPLISQNEENARNTLTQRNQAFVTEFGSMSPEHYGPYLDTVDFVTRISASKAVLAAAQHALGKAKEAETAAETELRIFKKEHPRAVAAAGTALELDAQGLRVAIDQADKERIHEAKRAGVAREDSERHKDAARELKERTSAANQSMRSLRAAITLPVGLVVEPETPEPDFAAQANALIEDYQGKGRAQAKAREGADKAFKQLSQRANSAALREAEPDIAAQMLRNEFEAACNDSARLIEAVDDRISTTASCLDSMQEDFQACLGELHNITSTAIRLLTSACNDKRIPEGAPYVGGKAILKMRARFGDINHDARRNQLAGYLDDLIAATTVPAKGAELVADAVMRIYNKPLGLEMLKMVPDEALQYVPVNKIQNSGGEGVVMAMFVYMLTNQLRAETQAKANKAGGGPLILDNPFAKATTSTLWKALRMLAEAMDVQLIVATALPDYNTVGEFGRFVRMRKAGKNTTTGRWHIETATLQLTAREESETAR